MGGGECHSICDFLGTSSNICAFDHGNWGKSYSIVGTVTSLLGTCLEVMSWHVYHHPRLHRQMLPGVSCRKLATLLRLPWSSYTFSAQPTITKLM